MLRTEGVRVVIGHRLITWKDRKVKIFILDYITEVRSQIFYMVCPEPGAFKKLFKVFLNRIYFRGQSETGPFHAFLSQCA